MLDQLLHALLGDLGQVDVEAVTRAYAAKDGDSPYVGPLPTEEAAEATLGLEPRP